MKHTHTHRYILAFAFRSRLRGVNGTRAKILRLFKYVIIIDQNVSAQLTPSLRHRKLRLKRQLFQ